MVLLVALFVLVVLLEVLVASFVVFRDGWAAAPVGVAVSSAVSWVDVAVVVVAVPSLAVAFVGSVSCCSAARSVSARAAW